MLPVYSILRAVRETLQQGDGEVVVEGPKGTGRICVSGGQIAWVVAGGDGQRLASVLAEVTTQPVAELRSFCDRAIEAGRHPGEALVEDGVVGVDDVRAALRLHNSRQLTRLLAARVDKLHVDTRVRKYGAALLFTLPELLKVSDAARPSSSPGASPASSASPRPSMSPSMSPSPSPSPSPTPSPVRSREQVARVHEALRAIMGIDGAIAAAIVDWERGENLGSVGAPGFDVELAAMGNATLMRAKVSVLRTLGLAGPIEDLVITLPDQHHVIRPLSPSKGASPALSPGASPASTLFIYLAIDKVRGDPAVARHRLASIDQTLHL